MEKQNNSRAGALLNFWNWYLSFSPVNNLRISICKLMKHLHDEPEKLANFIYSKRINLIEEPREDHIDAFTAEYKNAEHSIKQFKEFVFKKVIEAYNENPTNYHSLHFSIVQSSCFGKSRLVLEAGQRCLNVVYGCLRQPKSTGFPVCNLDVFHFLLTDPSQEQLELFIMTIYYVASSIFLSDSYGYSADNQKPPLSIYEDVDQPVKFSLIWEGVTELMKRCIRKEDEESEQSIRSFWSLFQNNVDISDKYFALEKTDPNGKVLKGLSHLLIVFDEASLFNDYASHCTGDLFGKLLQAHQNLNPSTCVLVFIDNRFQDFRLLQYSDSHVDHRHELFPPYCDMLTADPDPTPMDESLVGLERLRKVFSYGRPAWYAMFFAPEYDLGIPGKMESILGFAKEKLSYRFEVKPVSNQAKIAISSIRFGIGWVIDHNLASELVEAYMATGLFMGRNRLVAEYIPEPLLAEAACQLLNGEQVGQKKSYAWKYEFDPEVLSELVLDFSRKCLSGAVHTGGIDRFFARLILSLSYDFVHLSALMTKQKDCERSRYGCSGWEIEHSSYFSNPISLGAFLNVLFPSRFQSEWISKCELEGNIEEPYAFFKLHGISQDNLDDYTVCFTSWYPLETANPDDISQDDLKYYYDRCLAINLLTGHKVTDLLIVMRNRKTSKYSYIRIHVKNDQKYDSNRNDPIDLALSPNEYFSEPSLHEDNIRICMELDRKTYISRFDSNFMNQFHQNFPRHLILLGTPQIFLDGGPLRETFRSIWKNDSKFG